MTRNPSTGPPVHVRDPSWRPSFGDGGTLTPEIGPGGNTRRVFSPAGLRTAVSGGGFALRALYRARCHIHDHPRCLRDETGGRYVRYARDGAAGAGVRCRPVCGAVARAWRERPEIAG